MQTTNQGQQAPTGHTSPAIHTQSIHTRAHFAQTWVSGLGDVKTRVWVHIITPKNIKSSDFNLAGFLRTPTPHFHVVQWKKYALQCAMPSTMH